MPNSYRRLQYISAFLGNLFEHYDLALYSLLSPFFASIFFSHENQISALILTYMIIPIGMLTRPLGALFFGYIGDHYSRRRALFISLSGLAVISLLLAFTPTYEQVGLFAPFLLALGRMLQNFFGIGEVLGGGIYLLEHTDEKNQDLISGLYGSSTVAGFLLASIGVSFLCYNQLLEDYWRFLYIFGGVTSLFGCILRKNLPSTPAKKVLHGLSVKETLLLAWSNRRVILLIAVVAGFSYANSSIAFVFFNGFIPLISTVSKEQMIHLNTFLLFFDFVSLPLFGLLAKYYSRQKMMLYSSIVVVFLAMPLFNLLETANLATIILVRIIIVTLGVWFTASFHSWAQKMAPASHRYTFISLGYALGSQFLGGLTAPFSLWLYQKTDEVWLAASYWVVLAILVSICLLRTKQRQK